MTAQQLPNGNLLVPFRVEAEDGTIGDGWVEIGKDHPEYQDWVEDMKRSSIPSDVAALAMVEAAATDDPDAMDDIFTLGR